MNRRLIPLLVFISLTLLLSLPLLKEKDPTVLSSALIGKPAPSFRLPLLDEKKKGVFFATEDLKGHVSVVNVFASWCVPCRAEQPVLLHMAEKTDAAFFAVNYKDQPAAARAFLKQAGNPYRKTGIDSAGRAAIDWGVYGVPETFLIDRSGVIRYRHAGPVTMNDADEKLIPLIRELSQ